MGVLQCVGAASDVALGEAARFDLDFRESVIVLHSPCMGRQSVSAVRQSVSAGALGVAAIRFWSLLSTPTGTDFQPVFRAYHINLPRSRLEKRVAFFTMACCCVQRLSCRCSKKLITTIATELLNVTSFGLSIELCLNRRSPSRA